MTPGEGAVRDPVLEGDGSAADGLNARKDAFLAGMEEKVRAGTGNYFLPGGIWAEEECFRAIAEDQEFYLDGEGAGHRLCRVWGGPGE